MRRRSITFLILACGVSTFLISLAYDLSWRRGTQLIGIGRKYGPTKQEDGGMEQSAGVAAGAFREPKVESTSPYPVGRTKPAGSTYTKCLVLPRLKSENTSWVEEELGDMMESGILTTAVYTVNDRKAKLHPPANKGHEVMVYLSYIIDHYDTLADVSIFMHAHRFAWHNSDLLGTDAAKMVRYLSAERVTREGYMNLRCAWDPGCPAWLHPGTTKDNSDKPEEFVLAECWSELFPLDPVPEVLAQPCCAQFGVSRERIRATPKMRYIVMRDWLLRTDLDDYLSGRVFEHIWQYIFTAAPIYCPSMSACYCDGYGLCFGGAKPFDYYFELRYNLYELEDQLRLWQKKADEVAELRAKNGRVEVEVPEAGQDGELKSQIDRIRSEMDALWQAAFERGKDPRQRAMESSREWKHGDGY